jgi:hypothetical protein
MVVVMQTALGSFDFAGFFASEETCCAQDDRDRRTTEKRRWQGRKAASLRMTEMEIGIEIEREGGKKGKPLRSG